MPDLVSVDWICLVGHSVYQLASYTERIQDWIGWSTITWSVEQGVNSDHHLAAGYSSTNEQAQRSSLDPSKRHVKDLGVVLEGQLIMANHVAALSRSCFWYIRQLKSIKQSLTPAALKTLVYVFIISRIDYCSSAFTDISAQLIQRLQATQNAADRLITGTIWHWYWVNSVWYQGQWSNQTNNIQQE